MMGRGRERCVNLLTFAVEDQSIRPTMTFYLISPPYPASLYSSPQVLLPPLITAIPSSATVLGIAEDQENQEEKMLACINISHCVLEFEKLGSSNTKRLVKAQIVGDRSKGVYEINPEHPIIKKSGLQMHQV
ncbi:hypothetical protein ACS0TY_035760 [Phlomoides rotata]